MARFSCALFLALGLGVAVPAAGQTTRAADGPSATAARPAGRGPADRWLGPDKPAHVLGAYMAAGSGYAAGIELEWDGGRRRAAALATAAAASLAKEAFDAAVQGERWSWKDLGADAAGALLFVVLTLAAER